MVEALPIGPDSVHRAAEVLVTEHGSEARAIARKRAKQTLDTLLKEQPKFHGEQRTKRKNYQIQPRVLQWIIDNLAEDISSLETGCGYSSIILSLLSNEHTVISPHSKEHDLIKEWSADHEIDLSHVNFHADLSQYVLPTLEKTDLDFVLIDGDHAFPGPFIDWYYTADRIQLDGFVIVDDTQIITGRILSEFLLSETSRWRLAAELGQTSIFKRITAGPVARGLFWIEQPYCQNTLAPRFTIEKAVRRLKRKFKP